MYALRCTLVIEMHMVMEEGINTTTAPETCAHLASRTTLLCRHGHK